MTRKERILKMFLKDGVKLSCTEVSKKIMKSEKIDPKSSVAHYLSGSVTTILARLVKDGKLRYADAVTTRGGHIYTKNKMP